VRELTEPRLTYTRTKLETADRAKEDLQSRRFSSTRKGDVSPNCLSSLFDSGGSQFNREAAVAIEIGDLANDSWFLEFNGDMYSASQ